MVGPGRRGYALWGWAETETGAGAGIGRGWVKVRDARGDYFGFPFLRCPIRFSIVTDRRRGDQETERQLNELQSVHGVDAELVERGADGGYHVVDDRAVDRQPKGYE
jgi:hypothetical protein